MRWMNPLLRTALEMAVATAIALLGMAALVWCGVHAGASLMALIGGIVWKSKRDPDWLADWYMRNVRANAAWEIEQAKKKGTPQYPRSQVRFDSRFRGKRS